MIAICYFDIKKSANCVNRHTLSPDDIFASSGVIDSSSVLF
jgi:hypothetical protein